MYCALGNWSFSLHNRPDFSSTVVQRPNLENPFRSTGQIQDLKTLGHCRAAAVPHSPSPASAMTSHHTNPARHLLPLLAALVLLVSPALGFSPAPLLHSIHRPDGGTLGRCPLSTSTHPPPLRSLHDASPASLGVHGRRSAGGRIAPARHSGTPSHRSPGQTSLKASGPPRSDSGEERHTAPGGGGMPRRAVLLGNPEP